MRLPLALLQLASPPRFYALAARLEPWLYGVAVALFIAGAVGGLVFAPPDYLQGDGFRIIFVHVPSAWLSMQVYVFMAACAIGVLVWRSKVGGVLMVAAAPIGMTFTAVTLATGSLWGKPMWGTWWAWDARLTSELVLLFIYLGFIGLQQSLPDGQQTRRVGAILVLVGLVNIPIIHYSVVWWNTLHQPKTISVFGETKIAAEMLWPLLAMALSFTLFFAAVSLTSARAGLLASEAHARWAKEVAGG